MLLQRLLLTLLLVFGCASTTIAEGIDRRLSLSWEKNYLTIRGDIPGDTITIMYLEAYCRPGSTDRDWSETVIPHKTELTHRSEDGRVIELRDKLADGVVVNHVITAEKDELTFEVVAHNPTEKASQAHWAQPCLRVDRFTGAGNADSRELVPAYARKCFLFIDGKFTRLPTTPWAEKARYVPGQVYCPKHVDRNDVNPRPLSPLVPSSSLTGCFSADDKLILATAWEPYQEVFQGVIACMHTDFRVGGLEPGETRKIRGKLYVVPADPEALQKRFETDFPEQKRQ